MSSDSPSFVWLLQRHYFDGEVFGGGVESDEIRVWEGGGNEDKKAKISVWIEN